MMKGNTPWRDYATDPPPNDSVVIVWLDKPVLWSQLHSMRINAGGISVIAGTFLFDLNAKILCWQDASELADTVPLKYKKETS
ncbi:hypothetical protein vBRpoSV10_99 [Ruegeria phage vB_RpoS-V10]|nr:hypothetical protein vBRpoSV10_99 [Ruegeria phage vB_RpoS-V10]